MENEKERESRCPDIPHIIHHIWIDSKDGRSPIPERYEKYIETFKDMNPEWSLRRWNSQMIEKLMEKEPSLFKYRELYTRMKRPIMKADVARLMVLYCYGGLYLDLDFICLRPLDELLLKYPYPIILAPVPDCSLTSGSICNGFMASVPEHPIWLLYLDEIEKRTPSSGDSYDILNVTGPGVFYHVASGWSREWSSYTIPWYMVLPLDGKGKPVAQIASKWNLIQNQIKNGNVEPSRAYSLYDGPYLCTIWWEGTRWADKIWDEIIRNLILGYGAVIVIMVLLIVLTSTLRNKRSVSRVEL